MLTTKSRYQFQEALLQSFVFWGALIKEVIWEDHVGHPQAEEHHQRSSRVHRHGKTDVVCAVRDTNGKAGAAFLCVVNQTIAVIDQIKALVSIGGIIQAFVSGMDLKDKQVK